MLSGDRRLGGGVQLPYAGVAKDVGSEKWLTAKPTAPYIVVLAEVYDPTNAADFGRTLYPLECSAGQPLGVKNLSTARLLDAPCAGKVVALATAANTWPATSVFTSDAVVVLYNPATGDVHYIRRTGPPPPPPPPPRLRVPAKEGTGG